MKKKFKVIFLSGFLIISTLNAQASQNQRVNLNTDHQQLFVQAEELLSKNKLVEYKAVYEKLTNYPLLPYLKQRQLLKNIEQSTPVQIEEFLNKYEGTPLDWPLRKAWLMFLVKKDKGTAFRKFYRETTNTVLNCHYLNYALRSGDSEPEIFTKVTKLWLTGESLDKACDPLLESWSKAHYRTDELVLQRISLAAAGGNHTLIPYLTSLLPQEKQYLGDLWHKVRRNPAFVTKEDKFIEKSDIESQIYTYGIKRLIWRDPETAILSYNKSLKTFNFSIAQQQEIIEKFAIALTNKKHPEASHWLAKLDDKNINSSLLHSQLITLLAKSNWQDIRDQLVLMPEHYKEKLQWKYWYARSLIANQDKALGKSLMREISTKRHYYGFLAAGYLDTAVSLQNEPLQISQLEKNNILEYPSAKRAFELYYLERYSEARREWDYWLTKLNSREKLVAAKLANEKGWFDRTIFTLSEEGYLNDVELRFPKAFHNKINAHANKQAINPAWAFAITRRESSFMTDARSPVGASGLMQLMPNTAKQLEKGSVSRKYLYNADNNIKLGTKYLKELLEKNKGNQVLATASYNAGPHRVKTWLKNSKAMPADIWIETIPFKETRNYVKSVLAYQEIYQHKPGQVSEIFAEVIKMNIGG